MSFIFGFCRITTLIGAMAALMAYEANAAGLDQATCGAYANKAWKSVQTMKGYNCSEVGDMGPGRFSQSLSEHRDWCTNYATQESMEYEQDQREAARASCVNNGLLEMVCQQYATDAVEMSHQYQINRCTDEHHPVGRFDWRFQAHFEWCKYTAKGGDPIYSENDARTAELQECKDRNAASRFRPVTKLSVHRTTTEDQSAEDDPSETTELVEPEQRIERVVIGNRYVEVPAYAEDDEDSGLGTVAKGVVLGAAAVTTGVVAAKAIDYIDEHRDGIKEAASDLKDKIKDKLEGGGGFDRVKAGVDELKDKVKERLESRDVTVLKDKIKDKLEGSGGFDRVKSGLGEFKDKVKERLETRRVTDLKDKLKERAGGISKVASGMKEKLKDGFSRSGGLRKAASGFKDAVKSKLSGAGGVMKGMARAGGGLLGRLVRR